VFGVSPHNPSGGTPEAAGETRPPSRDLHRVYPSYEAPRLAGLPVEIRSVGRNGKAPMSDPSARIHVVEDDPGFRRVIAACLEAAGFRVLLVEDETNAVQEIWAQQPDLVLLDINLSSASGLDICRELRRRQFRAPILMVTGLAAVDDRVDGLEAGADDYLPKPFDDRELVARVRALLRREQREVDAPKQVTFGDVQVDFERRVATRGGAALQLTKTEFNLLSVLAQNAGKPVSRKTLLDTVWNYARTPDTRTVDTHIWRLRRKLGDTGENPRWLKQTTGQGYLLELGRNRR
jgi:DNA-binding response OmpR family regulator